MVLIDTSVWIEFLRGNGKFFNHVSELLESGNVHCVEAIFAELLQGANNKREIEIITAYWNNIHNSNEKGLWIESGKLSYEKKLFNKDVGIIDSMIIAYAIKYNIKVWSLDKKLLSILDRNLIYKP
ncbi:MAG: PIN domain-containing protein [Leptospirales bacterium]